MFGWQGGFLIIISSGLTFRAKLCPAHRTFGASLSCCKKAESALAMNQSTDREKSMATAKKSVKRAKKSAIVASRPARKKPAKKKTDARPRDQTRQKIFHDPSRQPHRQGARPGTERRRTRGKGFHASRRQEHSRGEKSVGRGAEKAGADTAQSGERRQQRGKECRGADSFRAQGGGRGDARSCRNADALDDAKEEMNRWRVAKPLVAGLNGAEQSRRAQNSTLRRAPREACGARRFRLQA
jgi:hypothetical protein